MLNRELKDAKCPAVSKTSECVALVDERKCLARELETAREYVRKLRSRVKTEQTSRKVILRRLEATNTHSSFCLPPNLIDLLFLPQGATTSTILKLYKTLSVLCHPYNGGQKNLFKIILQAMNIMEEEKTRSFLKSKIENAEEYWNSNMDNKNTSELVEHSFLLDGGSIVIPK